MKMAVSRGIERERFFSHKLFWKEYKRPTIHGSSLPLSLIEFLHLIEVGLCLTAGEEAKSPP
jgi:hypothetical protein